MPQLPVELFGVIGEFLSGDLCFGTLANLNAACRAVQEETLPVLYETLVLRWSDTISDDISRSSECKGWGYVK